VPVSQLVAFLLYELVFQLKKKTISLGSYKTVSGCPKFECNLALKRRAMRCRGKREYCPKFI